MHVLTDFPTFRVKVHLVQIKHSHSTGVPGRTAGRKGSHHRQWFSQWFKCKFGDLETECGQRVSATQSGIPVTGSQLSLQLDEDLCNAYDATKILSWISLPHHKIPQNFILARISNVTLGDPEWSWTIFGFHKLGSATQFNLSAYLCLWWQCWLDREKPILKQLSRRKLDLRFVVKFYTPDPGMLEDELTRYFIVFSCTEQVKDSCLFISLKYWTADSLKISAVE